MWLALFLAILPAISLVWILLGVSIFDFGRLLKFPFAENIQKVAIITEVGTKIDKSLLGKVLPDRANSSSSLFKDPVNEHAASFFAMCIAAGLSLWLFSNFILRWIIIRISFKPEEIALINLPEDKGKN